MTKINPVRNENFVYNASNASNASSTAEADFTQMLTEALQSQLIEESVTLDNSSNQSGQINNNYGSLESILLSSAAAGEADSTQTALFMLCMMMQENPDSEIAPLLNTMAAMLENLSSESQSAMRGKVMASSYEPYILDTVDRNVFNTPAVNLPVEPWKAVTPLINGNITNRSPELLNQIIGQFNVERAERYQPFRKGNDTYCNIFVWDVTTALGAEIPHYVDAETGSPRTYPYIKGAKEMGANATHDWLLSQGPQYGWRQVSAEEAQAYANTGKPAVTAWKNPTGAAGHVQIVCPSQNRGYDSIRGVTVAQAGAKVTDYAYISSTFGGSKLANVKYFVHE